MMDKKCSNCNIHFASSQSLWNHKQRCGKKAYTQVPAKRSRQDIMGRGVDSSGMNPKLLFLDEIINAREKEAENTSGIREEAETPNITREEAETSHIKKILTRLNCDEKTDLIQVDEDLAILFKSLWKDKTTNLWELVMIISIWLYRGDITPKQFQKMNNIILSAQKCKIEMDDKTLIQATLDYFTKDDKVKLKTMISEFKVDNSDKVELEKAINDGYYFDEDYDRILGYLRRLHIPRTEELEFEMNLHKLRKDRHRVLTILNRLKDIEDEERFAERVTSLVRENLISDDTSKKLLEKDAIMELKNVVDILKNEGSGLYLSPRE